MLPRFDALEDFAVPLGSLREAALLSGRSLAALNCRVNHPRRNGSCFSPEETDFFQRVTSALSEGDALVRHESEGSYHLILIDRSVDEIRHVADFIGHGGGPGSPVDVSVEDSLLPLLPDEPAAAPEPTAGSLVTNR